jgi:RHS repeat-associated protein
MDVREKSIGEQSGIVSHRNESLAVAAAHTTGAGGSRPTISLPKGGGAIRGIGEKFTVSPATGSGSLSVPIATSPSRAGFGPQLALSYDSGGGNGPFGFGWTLSLPSITRKTDKGLPQYDDAGESDTFILSGVEDLVRSLVQDNGKWVREITPTRTVYGKRYSIHRYRPRVEGLFARIERWTNPDDPQDTFWRSITKDNVTTWYGKTTESRISDPDDNSRIFSWLICESYDDKGNLAVYRYKPENSDQVDLTQANERNRTRPAKRYLKHILYGNRTPYFPDLNAETAVAQPTDWCFEMVFDYGEHDPANPVPAETGPKWICRPDSFSTYRSGFEVRTYRLCRRVLMFHHFEGEVDVGLNCLVRSTDFNYSAPPTDPRQAPYAFLLSITQMSYRRNGANGYLPGAMPPLEFSYSAATVDEAVRDIDSDGLENLPYGLDGSHYRWADLDGEGLSGIVTEQGGNWFYKANLSAANEQEVGGVRTRMPRFAPVEVVRHRPSTANMNAGRQQLMDLSGDGQLDLVDFEGAVPGFFERTRDQDWELFAAFPSLPNVDWRDPNLKFIDLTGDGLPDLLITDTSAFCWHQSLGSNGYGPAQRTLQTLDEENGPKLIFADGTESIFLADMSGDGLTDLVRIRNGEVCYWPNAGYGRFGAKVAMDHAPWFDRADVFNGRRIQLADIDGSGTADIIYLAGGAVHLYFNQSGNRWGDRYVLEHFPAADSVSNVTAIDLLGSGTTCLVWSSPAAAAARRPMRYIDLMGSQKPHLLTSFSNNLGAETVIRYAPSTKFYVADKLAGTPWVTRLPFPVHVVEQAQTYDLLSRNLFVARYVYHHGHFDGVEREFRGFGRVDQYDTETLATLSATSALPQPVNLDAASNLPPVCTKTWFHTGAFFGAGRISRHLAHEYYQEGDTSDAVAPLTPAQIDAMLLDDTVVPRDILLLDATRLAYDLSGEEAREACRALRGSVLRQEIYALDGTDAADRPYSVSERSYTIEALQPQGTNRFAVFFVHPRETLDLRYERRLYKVNGDTLAAADAPPPARTLADPRVSHGVTVSVDAFGNVLESVAIGYGRRYRDPALTAADQDKQRVMLATCVESTYTAPVLLADAYRAPLIAETSTFELIQLRPDSSLPDVTNLFGFDELRAKIDVASDGAHDVDFATADLGGLNAGEPYRRLIGRTRTFYRPDDMGAGAGDPRALLALRALEPLALSGATYTLAFTPSLIAQTFRRGGAALLPTPTDVLGSVASDGGGYVDLDGDGSWWAPSGRQYYIAAAPTSPHENDEARRHFFMARRFEDPFGSAGTFDYDGYDLLPARSTDEVGNVVAAQNDYRVLAPATLTDANGNRSAVSFDVHGFVTATALMGRTTENVGDQLAGFAADLAQADVDALYDADDPHAVAAPLLGNATSRLVYDLNRFVDTHAAAPDDPTRWQPPFSATITRETHFLALAPGQQSRLQLGFSYSDGFGREIQRKIQAEPGPVTSGGPSIDPRWVGNGWTIYDNKGNSVRQYEPFFSQLPAKGHQFEFGVAVGVSPIVLYDPVGRSLATIQPNHGYGKSVFDPWHAQAWDANDTVLSTDPTADPDVGDWFLRLAAADYSPTWYAQRAGGALGAAEQDAATKTVAHADTPTITYLDSLGRTILKIADNGAAGKVSTRFDLDIRSNQRAVRDALGRVAVTYDYNVANKRIHQASMDAGARWTLDDVAEKTIRSWDDRAHNFRSAYDALRRPVGRFVLGTSATLSDPRTRAKEVQYEKIVYGEGQPSDQALNLRTRVFQYLDCAGVTTSGGHNAATSRDEAYDFKGNLLRGTRRYLTDVQAIPDWSGPAPTFAADLFESSATFDALNRAVTGTQSDGTVMRLTFNAAGLLEQLSAEIRGAGTATSFVANLDYDARGRRVLAALGNGATTTYHYDPLTTRLQQLTTTRQGVPADQAVVQDLSFTYDPSANVTRIQDDADIHNTVYFRNRRVEPGADFTYDPIYRLTRASGREHLAAAGTSPPASSATSYNDAARIRLAHPGDGNAMGVYTEQYTYDAAGNITQLAHQSNQPAIPGWTRTYAYVETSLLEPAAKSNRLTRTTITDGAAPFNEDYAHDPHGNMTAMPQLQAMVWDFKDRLTATTRQAISGADSDGTARQGERTYYVYDAVGERVRKATLRQNGTLKNQRFYLKDFELYREYDAAGTTVTLERQTLLVVDDKNRVAIVETSTIDASAPAASLPATTTRYQFGNHLGSACLELDETGAVISYEEYYPFGSTSYQAGRSLAEVSLKRYRYTGKECDDETGLQYNRARYYARWLGRWTAADPTGIADGTNLYSYVNDNPILLIDPTGTDGDTPLTPNQGAGQRPPDTTAVTVTDPSGHVSTQTTTNTTTTDPTPAAQQPGTLKPPIYLSTSFGQPWQGVPYHFTLHEYTHSYGLSGGGPAPWSLSGGLNSWLGTFRYGVLGPRLDDDSEANKGRLSLDLGPIVGISATGSYLSGPPIGGGPAGGSGSSGGFVGGTVHLGIPLPQLGDDYGLGLYAAPQLNFSNNGISAGGSVTASIGHEPDSGESSDFNLSGSYVNSGSLNFPGSPTLGNLWSVGGLYTWGSTAKDLGSSQSHEVYGNYFRGTFGATTAGGTDGWAQGARFGYGHNWQWNWAQGPNQTNGFGLYVGGMLEYARIQPPTEAGAAPAPSGLNAATISAIVNITIGANVRPH